MNIRSFCNFRIIITLTTQGLLSITSGHGRTSSSSQKKVDPKHCVGPRKKTAHLDIQWPTSNQWRTAKIKRKEYRIFFPTCHISIPTLVYLYFAIGLFNKYLLLFSCKTRFSFSAMEVYFLEMGVFLERKRISLPIHF